MIARIFTLSLLSLTAACSQQIVPASAPAPKPAPVAAAPAPAPAAVPNSGDWVDWPLSPGDWVYRRDERGSIALYGPTGANALVTLRCDRNAGRIYLARASERGAGRGSMTIRSSSALKQFSGQPTGGSPPYVAVDISPRDSILDAIAYTRGRIAIETSGERGIAIPIWSEVPRVIEDCRG